MVSRQAPEFDRLLAGLARELGERDLPYMIIGGQAVLLHGEPRLTQDIDLTLGVPPSAADEVLRVCEVLRLEVLPDDAHAFAARTFVLPAADPPTGVRIDFVFSTTPYERNAIERAIRVPVGGEEVRFASAEDLILHKLFAGRAHDLEDVRGVVARKGADLDWGYIERWAHEFAAVEGRGNLPELVLEFRAEAGES